MYALTLSRRKWIEVDSPAGKGLGAAGSLGAGEPKAFLQQALNSPTSLVRKAQHLSEVEAL